MAETCEDPIARDMAQTALVAWANLVGTLVATMREADVPTDLIHGVLDRIERANEATIAKPGRDFLRPLLETVRETLPSND